MLSDGGTDVPLRPTCTAVPFKNDTNSHMLLFQIDSGITENSVF